MSDAVQVALIVAIPQLAAAVFALFVALQRLKKIHGDMNSRFDEWIAATKKASFAEGHLAATDEQEARNEDDFHKKE